MISYDVKKASNQEQLLINDACEHCKYSEPMSTGSDDANLEFIGEIGCVACYMCLHPRLNAIRCMLQVRQLQ